MNESPLLQSKRVLELAAEFSKNYLESIAERRVYPNEADRANLKALSTKLPEHACDPTQTVQLLQDIGSQNTVATAAGRYHGLVVGGSLPATVGARVLNAAWDQIATSDDTSPIAVYLEHVVSGWLREIFGLASQASVGFVTGTTMGNFICLAAARHRILSRQGWNVEKQGLNGAPKIRLVASQEIHVTVKKVVSMLGIGVNAIESVPCDKNGAMLVEKMPELDANTIVLTQAGNVNSGAVDPIHEIVKMTKASNAWLHVDGAFGLWAAACDSKRHLVNGLDQVDSCVTDGHKWLNTPYDCGIAMCRDPEAMHNCMSTVAPYFSASLDVPPKDMVPELSRSARSIDVWAALHSMGRNGLNDLVERCCRHAVFAAELLTNEGFEVLNDVVLNQVVVSHPQKEDQLEELTKRVCATGETWFGVTYWQGRSGFRMSFSSWVTSDHDVIRSVGTILREAKAMGIID